MDTAPCNEAQTALVVAYVSCSSICPSSMPSSSVTLNRSRLRRALLPCNGFHTRFQCGFLGDTFRRLQIRRLFRFVSCATAGIPSRCWNLASARSDYLQGESMESLRVRGRESGYESGSKRRIVAIRSRRICSDWWSLDLEE